MTTVHSLGDEYFPPEKWGQDHWSCLAYVETVMADLSRFEVGYDVHFRQKPHHTRVMLRDCPRPKRTSPTPPCMAPLMSPDCGTKLRDGSKVWNHDDWDCIVDMAAAGVFQQSPEEIEPGVSLTFSPKGEKVASALRSHKRKGGKFTDFVMPIWMIFSF